MTVKSFFYSMGIACWISVPIAHFALQSWENPKQQLITREFQYEEFRTIQEIAESETDKVMAQQGLLFAEKRRQEQIITEAQDVLDIYGVVVPEDIQIYCERAGAEFDICPEFLEAICWRESRFNPSAENEGCSGLMQISTKWHQQRMVDLEVKDIYDGEGNIRVGASYLAELFEKYEGDVDEVLKEYNGDSTKGVSAYAIEVMEISEALERVHGK